MSRLLRSLFTAAFLLAGSGPAVAATWHYPLHHDGGGYWQQRIRVVIDNTPNVHLEGTPLPVAIGEGEGQANLVGQRAEAIRLVNEHGTELLYAIRSATGELIHRGPIPAGAVMAIPAECPAQSSVVYYIYFDNPSGGESPEYYTGKPRAADLAPQSGLEAHPTARADKPERFALKEAAAPAAWTPAAFRGAATPDRRFAVRVFNFSDKPIENQLAAVEANGLSFRTGNRIRQSVAVVNDQGQVVPFAASYDTIFFEARVAPRNAGVWWVYSWDAPPNRLPQAAESGEALMARYNRVKNASFEQGTEMPEGWTCVAPEPRGEARLGMDDPERVDFGDKCARIEIPAGAPAQTCGWRQTVSVEPGKSYVARAWLKTKDVERPVLLKVRLYQADGKPCVENSTHLIDFPVYDRSDWTLLSAVLTMPADAAMAEVDLTTDCPGTLWHDEVVLAQGTAALPGPFEGRPVTESQSLATWQVPAVAKVFHDDPAPLKPAPAAISVARNEKEPLQLALRSGQSLKGIEVEAEPAVGPNGAKLPPWQVNVMGYVPVDYPTNYYHFWSPGWVRKDPHTRIDCDGWRGWWPDPLLPQNTLDLAANETGAIWLTVDVGQDQPAGDYAGKVRLRQQGRVLAEVPFTVHVWNFTLPKESHVGAIYDIRLGRRELWGDSPDKVEAQIQDLMAANRLCPEGIHASSGVRWENGKVVTDFTEFDRAAEYYFDKLGLPFSYLSRDFYMFGAMSEPRPKFGEKAYEGERPYQGDRSALRPEFRNAYKACLKAFWDHVKEKGWDKKLVLYISDEPLVDQGRIYPRPRPEIATQMKALCDLIHEVDPNIPIYSSTWYHVPEWDGYMDIWGIGYYGTVSEEQIAKLVAAGDRVWFTCDAHICLDTVNCGFERLIPYFCFKYGVQSYEFWGASWLTTDPYRYGWHADDSPSDKPGTRNYCRCPNGDGYVLYPGHTVGHDGPVTSVRFEQAREGVEDFEYFYRLRELAAKAKAAGKDTTNADAALAAVKAMVKIPTVTGRFTSKLLPDPQRVYEVRQAVAKAIESLEN